MNLKVTPKEALKTINALLYEAAALRSDFIGEYWSSDLERVEELVGSRVNPMEATIRASSLPSLLDRLNKFKKMVGDRLVDVYEEVAPAMLFVIADRKVTTDHIPKTEDGPYFYFEKELDLSIDFLESKYQEVRALMRSPLQFIKKSAALVYFDAVCKLSLDSNEALLCDIMTDLSIGEQREMDEIFELMSNEEPENFPKEWKKTIKNAIEGVNTKTNETFGFPIFRIKKSTVSLVLPTDLIASYR